MAQSHEPKVRDYTQDAFPNSAKPIINRLLGLAVLIALLFLGLYLLPEENDDRPRSASELRNEASEKLRRASGHLPAGLESVPSGANPQ